MYFPVNIFKTILKIFRCLIRANLGVLMGLQKGPSGTKAPWLSEVIQADEIMNSSVLRQLAATRPCNLQGIL